MIVTPRRGVEAEEEDDARDVIAVRGAARLFRRKECNGRKTERKVFFLLSRTASFFRLLVVEPEDEKIPLLFVSVVVGSLCRRRFHFIHLLLARRAGI